MLGATAGVTESNMLQYLGIIEQRTNELLAVQAYILAKVGLEGERERERHRERETETDRERQRQTDRQTDRQRCGIETETK